MDAITLLSPAKINLCLTVLQKRPDGYHEVEMVMQMVGLYDEVTVALAGSTVQVSCDGNAALAGEKNIAWKAATAMLKDLGRSMGLTITIKKNIPIAAGLGGGSGNAAAVLAALNRLLHAGLDQDHLARIGAGIGMDVPFFFFGPTVLAQGRGERVISLPVPAECWVLLVNPGFETSTAWVYKNVNLRLTKKVDCTKIARLSVRNIADGLHNDLEAVTAAAHPVITMIEDMLLAQGALGARMSGSGPTVFGLFETEAACRTAEHNLSGHGWRLYPAKTLTVSPFAEYL
jgi:4-diphosphocytidyl-2-C-methyl-D-erythritol kinase